MTINLTAYETTFGRAINTEKTTEAIRRLVIQNVHLYDKITKLIKSVNFLPLEITGYSSEEALIPMFNHPLIMGNKKDSYLCYDFRKTVKFSDTDNKLIVKNISEHEFSVQRFNANFAWVNGNKIAMRRSMNFAGILYAEWLTDIITKRFNLDRADTDKLLIISHAFFMSLFVEGDTFSDDERLEYIGITSKLLNKSYGDVEFIYNNIGEFKNISDYCKTIVKILENIRLKDFDTASLFTIVSMSWYGMDSKEYIITALEHVPTWITIAYASIESKTFKHSKVATVADAISRRNKSNVEEFVKNFKYLMVSYTDNGISLESLIDNTYKEFLESI